MEDGNDPVPNGTDAPQQETGQPPAFLTGAKTWVAAVSAVVIALAGLKTAWSQLFPADPAPAVQAAAAMPEAAPRPAAAAASAEEEEGDPELYTGDRLRMEWTGKKWQLSSPDGVFLYDEMLSTEGSWVLGFDKSNDEYIRWPIEGGTMEYSKDDRQSWVTYGEVLPAAE